MLEQAKGNTLALLHEVARVHSLTSDIKFVAKKGVRPHQERKSNHLLHVLRVSPCGEQDRLPRATTERVCDNASNDTHIASAS